MNPIYIAHMMTTFKIQSSTYGLKAKVQRKARENSTYLLNITDVI